MTLTCCRCSAVFSGPQHEAMDLGWVGAGLIDPKGRTWCPKETARDIADDVQATKAKR